ncbi:MAG: gamma-glutamyltranspeptidase / glutathione hydrolase [Clostridiales bacterium]|jgi:gamma-glutamyltranspeptidase/glutathione hydrolase|nr:gamma-glutamyltranspeptidase / glutathione hydrolase [Clostridiales bacterium]MDN5298804.1 gamma-glutamyltranspeptidase / glutathione hydrolase [Clostridiales bacterium]
MKFTKKLIAILLTMMLLAGCSAPAAQTPEPSNEPAQAAETTTEQAEPEAAEPEAAYSSLDDFVLYDEQGVLTTVGRDDSGENGVVSSGKYEASKIGRAIMEKGGNAVDAAVAVGFTLGLAEPNSTGVGGGGFMTLHTESGDTLFIDFRERAPMAATPDMWQTYTNADGKTVVIGNQNTDGGKSVGIPGNVAGLLYALENYGTMSREEVLQPVIDLCRAGVNVSPTLSGDMKNNYDKMMLYSECGDIFLKEVDGMKYPYEIGENFKNEDYAHTLELIAEGGADVFYKGEIAEAVVASVNKYGGLFTMEDMANYQVEVTEPVQGTYRGYEIMSSPTPSSGGTIVLEILNILENFDLPSMEDNSAEELHLFSEAFKMAYADRGAYMGDPKYVDVPLKGLLSKDYAAKLAKKIDVNTAAENVMPDDPWMFEHEDTTHYSVADKAGNIVSVTMTVNYIFGSKVAVPGYGFVMNDEMADFVVQADHPNSITGGKTPLSSMSPTIVLKDGKPFAVVGTPGGTTIISTVAQIISNLVDHDMGMQEAIDAPRIKGFANNTITVESRLDPEVISSLEDMGHIIDMSSEWNRSFGSVNAIKFAEDGVLDGGADPRRDGKALGF